MNTRKYALPTLILASAFLLHGNMAQAHQKKPAPKVPTLTWESTGVDKETDAPLGKLFVNIAGKKIFIKKTFGTVNPFHKDDFKRLSIPQSATSAVGSWYAGAGDMWFVVPVKDKVYVKTTFQQETGGDPEAVPYGTWKTIAVFSSKGKRLKS